MIILAKKSTKVLGETKGFTVAAQMDKDELDLIVWSLEAFVARSGGQSVHPFALRTLEGLKVAYRMGDK